ncbi:MAG: hypothetical protein V1778_03505 [bacterium]
MLTLRVRRILYMSFSAVFVLIAATLLLYGSGFRFDWSRKAFYQPSFIVFSVVPQPDRCFIDNQPLACMGTSFRVVAAPGNHALRLERSGYFSWEGSVAARSGIVSSLGDIRLFRQQSSQVIADQVMRVTASPNAKYAVVLRKTQPVLQLIDLEMSVVTPLPFEGHGAVEEMAWSPSSTEIAVQSVDNGQQTLTFLPVTGAASVVPIVAPALERFQWSTRRPHHLFYLQDGVLSDLDLDASVSTVVATNVAAWTESGNALTLISPEGNVETLDAQNPFTSSRAHLGTLLHFRHPQFVTGSSSFLAIHDPESKQLALFRLSDRVPQPLLYHNITHCSWSEDMSTLLLGSEYELFTFNVLRSEPRLLRRSGEPLGAVLWFPNYPYLLVQQNRSLIVLDALARSTPLTIGFLQGVPQELFLNRSNNTFFSLSDEKVVAQSL